MDKLKIQGGRRLQGEVAISGAKNAALPELCAALLTGDAVTLQNVPRLQDVNTMLKLLRSMGMRADWLADVGSPGAYTVHLQAGELNHLEASYDLVKTMRASILVLGPLLSRFGQGRVSLPGGCAIGSRPVDQHIKGLQAMGAEIEVDHGYIVAKAKRLKGAHITTDMITVTGTENLLMAATLAQGETVLENAAQEPEVVDLAEMLIGMGARIEGHGTSSIHVQGVDALNGYTHTVVPDRIEAGTFLCAVAATGGTVVLKQARAEHLDAVIPTAGRCARLRRGQFFRIRRRAYAGAELSHRRYPGFPTDMQAQFMALNSIAKGRATITETIFENRFMHVNELLRLGAQIHADGRVAVVDGVEHLSGATVMATGLRASASLVIAGLVAQGETLVDRIYHLDRGYDCMEGKLRALGAKIERVKA